MFSYTMHWGRKTVLSSTIRRLYNKNSAPPKLSDSERIKPRCGSRNRTDIDVLLELVAHGTLHNEYPRRAIRTTVH